MPSSNTTEISTLYDRLMAEAEKLVEEASKIVQDEGEVRRMLFEAAEAAIKAAMATLPTYNPHHYYQPPLPQPWNNAPWITPLGTPPNVSVVPV